MTEEKLSRISWAIDVSAKSPKQAVVLAVNYLGPMEPARWSYSALNRETGEESNHEGQELFR